jgi:hypothetical protein
MLFSALSPALAAAVLADCPAALGQMLGLPEFRDGAAAPEHQTHQTHQTQHAHAAAASAADGAGAEESAPPQPDGSLRHDHGIYCSLCLNPASTAAVIAAPFDRTRRRVSFLPLPRSSAHLARTLLNGRPQHAGAFSRIP